MTLAIKVVGFFALAFVLALSLEELRSIHASLGIGRRLRGIWRALRGRG